jgi:DNA-binding transcriptional LysR family regulator
MEQRQLRYFTAVAEHLNYSEVSRRIHVAQPAISQTILDLEEELRVRLLLRDRQYGYGARRFRETITTQRIG